MRMRLDARKMAIGRRLNWGFFLVISIPIFVICVFAYQMTFRSSQQKISTFSADIVLTVSENIASMVNSLDNHSIDIAYNDMLQQTLEEYRTLTDRALNAREKQLAGAISKKFIVNAQVTDITALTLDQQPVYCYGNSHFRLRPSADSVQALYDKINALNENAVFMPVNAQFEQRILPGVNFTRGNGFVLARIVVSAAHGKPIGLLVMKISDASMRKHYQDLDLGEGSMVFIVNSQSQIVSASDSRFQPGDVHQIPDLASAFSAKVNGGSADTVFDGKPYLSVYNRIEGTDWLLLGFVSYDYINRDSWALGCSIMGIGVLCLLLAFFVGRYLSGSIIAPMNRLDQVMEVVAKGDLGAANAIDDNEPDELGTLSRRFQWMANELDAQMQRTIENEQQKRDAEMRALQYQINPHFMSNTLNTIVYLAKIQGVENIERVTKALISLLLASLGKGGKMLPVRKEIETLKDYLYIQKFKFGGDVEVRFEIAPDIADNLVPSFLLQPILENALLHGISARLDSALIVISGMKVGQDLYFEIVDNGIGMDEEKVREVLSANQEKTQIPFSKMGIGNVNERIAILFGREYGLTIASTPGVMTKVMIHLPAIEEEGTPCSVS